MEKGDKPKAKAKAKDKVVKQKQSQKQSVKIVIGETKKGKRKYVRKPKQAKPVINNIVGYRGTTAVSYLGGEGDVNQVITLPARQPEPILKQPPKPQQKPPPQPPKLSEVQAPTTLDTELTARSELVFPKARTPAFQEVLEPVPKKATKAKARSTIVKIGEGIGDFIRKNLLEQPADLQTQEPSNAMEEPRPPLTIKPEAPPVKPKPTRKQPASKTQSGLMKGKTDVPISIVASKEVERGQMGMEDVNVAPVIKVKALEQVAEAPKEQTQDVVKPKKEQKIYEEASPAYRYVEQAKMFSEEQTQKRAKEIEQMKEYRKRQGEQMEMTIEDVNVSQGVESLQDPELERDPELEAKILNLQQEVVPRRIVADTIEDIISTIETPVFSENPDFRTISQNVEIESPESAQLDYGETGESTLGEEGFIPVGNVRGMVEAIEKKAGRPKKYESPELAKEVKKQQTLESNRRRAAEKKFAELTQRLVAKSKLDEEYQEFLGSDFVSLEQTTEAVRAITEGARKQARKEAEMEEQSIMRGIPQIYLAQPIESDDIFTALEINKKAYEGDFQSQDFNQQFGDLTGTNNFSKLLPMVGEEDQGYSDENPKVTATLFSDDAIDSNLPFIGAEGFEFLG